MSTPSRKAYRRAILACAVLAGLLLAWAALPTGAQLPLAEPRPDPVITLPAVSMNSTLRLAGAYASAQKGPLVAPPVIEGRLLLIHPNGSFSLFGPFPIQVIQNLKDAPNMFALRAEIKLETLNFFAAGEVGGAVLSLRTVNAQQGNRLARGLWTAGVYVEEVSAVGTPLFSSYAAWLAEPRPDPIFAIPVLP